MQSFTKIEIQLTADTLTTVAEQLERDTGTAETQIERGLSALRSEQLKSIAGKLAAAADGDKRIAIR